LDLYSLNDIRTLLNAYLTSKGLINKVDQAYINLNSPLLACVTSKSAGEAGKKAGRGGQEEGQQPLEFMKRDELLKKIVEHMQSWYEVKAEGKEVTR